MEGLDAAAALPRAERLARVMAGCSTARDERMNCSCIGRVCSKQAADGKRPFHGDSPLQHDPFWRDCIAFHEYFNGDTGKGAGASHQTGWTGLVAKLIQQQLDNHSAKR